jgi:hypothetical protein
VNDHRSDTIICQSLQGRLQVKAISELTQLADIAMREVHQAQGFAEQLLSPGNFLLGPGGPAGVEVEIEGGRYSTMAGFGEQAQVAAFEHRLSKPHIRPQEVGAAIQSGKVKVLEAKGFIVREATEKMPLAVGQTQGDGGAGRTMRVTAKARLHAVAFHGVP